MSETPVLVFGRAGKLALALSRLPHVAQDWLFLSRASCNIALPGQARDAIMALRPNVIINAAAYTAVDSAEADPGQAEAINRDAPGEIAIAAKQIGAHFIHVSTDFVFDGTARAPYSEADTPNPLNTYGQTKLGGETRVLEASDTFNVVRTAWVFSQDGASFPQTMVKLFNVRDSLDVVSDLVGSPTPADDLAIALERLSTAGKARPSGLLHYAGAPHVSRYDFAQEIAAVWSEQANRAAPEISPVTSAAYPTDAKRPAFSALDSSQICDALRIAPADWRTALHRQMPHWIRQAESSL